MKSIWILLLLAIVCTSFAQVPSLTVVSSKDEKPMELSSLTIDVEVVGNIATTTYDMNFYNPNNRILTGELSMPMAEGQEICRYALDVNGKLREGVIVEKIKARQTFEKVVRRKIDPGIINKTKGNFFKTKIYPVPSKGYKRVVLAICETLDGDDTSYKYAVPLESAGKIKDFDLKIKVADKSPELKGFLAGLKKVICGEDDGYKTIKYKKKNFKTKKELAFDIPKYVTNDYEVYTSEYEGETYFYITMEPPVFKSETKSTPQMLTVYWDVSNSGDKRDIEKETAFLSDYLKTLSGNAKVEVITFSNEIHKKKVFSGKSISSQVKSYLEELKYDGGTNLMNLDFTVKADEILLFSDGINTLGKENTTLGDVPVYTISSSTGSNYGYLKKLSGESGGEYLNLRKLSVEEALQRINTVSQRFLSFEEVDGNVYEVYPKSMSSYGKTFEIVGLLGTDEAELEISFGRINGKKITKTVVINKDAQAKVQRIWAVKKIQYLEQDYEENKEKLLNLAREHTIVTQNTSLLVLDRLQDYIRHGIEPPPELQTESFKRQVAWKNNRKKTKSEKKVPFLENFRFVQKLFRWYYPKERMGAISGVVINENGEAVPYIKVSINKYGYNITSVTTDSNGEYSISGLVPSVYTMVFSSREIEEVVIENVKIDAGSNIIINRDVDLIDKKHVKVDRLNNKTVNKEVDVIDAKGIKISRHDVSGDSKISGVVIDKRKESLQGTFVLVYLDDSLVGNTMTNENGRYSITGLTAGSYTIKFNRMGYKKIQFTNVKIRDNESLEVNAKLEANPMKVSGITASNERLESHRENETSLEDSNISSIDELLGNSPGTVTVGGVSHARGGRANETTIMIDGVQVSDPVEGGASLSVSEEAVQNTRAMFSFPAEYGDSQSSVMNIVERGRSRSKKSKGGDKSGINVAGWSSNTEYIKKMRKADIDEFWELYYKQKKEDFRNPYFYFNSAKALVEKQRPEDAYRVFTNMVEIDLENPVLMRILAKKLVEIGKFEPAIMLFEEVKKLRPEEPQSYRDLALAYQAAGKLQMALDTFNHIMNNKWERFSEIKPIIINEMNSMISGHKDQLDLTDINTDLIHPFEYDVRIVLDWSSNDNDIDLWVIEPSGEKCYYQNKNTKSGGKLSKDFTRGYGPEEYTIRKAEKGTYRIKAKYYSESRQELTGSVIVYASIYTNYGKTDQKVKRIEVKLKKSNDVMFIGEIEI